VNVEATRRFLDEENANSPLTKFNLLKAETILRWIVHIRDNAAPVGDHLSFGTYSRHCAAVAHLSRSYRVTRMAEGQQQDQEPQQRVSLADTLHALLSIRVGQPLGRSRGGYKEKITFQVSDGIHVLEQKCYARFERVKQELLERRSSSLYMAMRKGFISRK
jgi:hypothetical protein